MSLFYVLVADSIHQLDIELVYRSDEIPHIRAHRFIPSFLRSCPLLAIVAGALSCLEDYVHGLCSTERIEYITKGWRELLRKSSLS